MINHNFFSGMSLRGLILERSQLLCKVTIYSYIYETYWVVELTRMSAKFQNFSEKNPLT